MNVILADSNDLVRIGLRTVLASDARINIVGEARSNNDLKEQLKSFETDIVIIDYTAPGFSIDIIPQVLTKNKNVRFVAVTPEQSAVTVLDALRSGVASYVKKDCDIAEIMSSVKETFAGNKFFCGQILETIQKASIDVDDIDFESFSCEPVSLSEREIEIITLIAEGHTNGQISDMLHLSTHTVTTHRKNIMSKLGVKNTAAIVMYAVKKNLVSPNKFLFAGEGN
ncbi:MAG: response regulator transcription factor [Crocinitomicaceae bacterium]|nr:response regulator transcription factor [Crocinitomicaceae bacterium]